MGKWLKQHPLAFKRACILILVLFCISLPPIWAYHKWQQQWRDYERIVRYNEAQRMASYAGLLGFDSNYGSDEYIVFAVDFFNHDDCVLVLSEAESGGYPDNVVVAWSTEDTERILYNLNVYILEHDIDPARFSLEYPVTIDDAVNNWEDVYNLLFSFRSPDLDKLILDPTIAPF